MLDNAAIANSPCKGPPSFSCSRWPGPISAGQPRPCRGVKPASSSAASPSCSPAFPGYPGHGASCRLRSCRSPGSSTPSRMIRRRPDLVVLVVVLVGTLVTVATFLGSLLLSRDSELAIGERRVRDFGIMVGEHTARSFEAVDILLREIATDLSERKRDWENWEASRGWNYLATHHATSLPQLRDLIIFDREGLQRYISTYFPTPRINVRDRPYFIALEDGTDVHHLRPLHRAQLGALHLCAGPPHRRCPAQIRGRRLRRHRNRLFSGFLLGQPPRGRFRIGHHQRQGPDRRHLPPDRSQQAIADPRRTRARSALRRPACATGCRRPASRATTD